MDRMAEAERNVEALIAELQQARAGLQPWHADRFQEQRSDLGDELQRIGLAAFLSELLEDADVPSISSAFLDLDADEPGRRASHEVWTRTASRRLPDLWGWLQANQSRGMWETWWCRDVALVPDEDTVEVLRRASAPLMSIGHIAETWAARAGLQHGTAEHNWRWLALGRGLEVSLPEFPDLLRALVRSFRERDLLPTHHRVQVVRQPNRPSMVLPVRVPGHSVLFSPSAVSPLSIQYLQHELAHLSEHALRPPDAALHERWRFDPVRSEGWALLFEHLLQDPRWLCRLGLAPGDAEQIAAFLREEEAFTRGLIAADLTLDRRLPALGSVEEARQEAAAIARELGIEWAPEIMLFRMPGMLQWRSYIAGWAWRDAVLDTLESRFGPEWHDDVDAWAALRTAIATVGSASAALQSLNTDA